MDKLFERLRESHPKIAFKQGSPIDVAALVAAPEPHFGTVSWTPPPSYVACLDAMGGFSLDWSDVDGRSTLYVLTPKMIKRQSEAVYIPEGVGFGDDERDLTTNHLVPFVHFDGEASFCFDVSSEGPEYEVWYHHQDNTRTFRFEDGEPVEPSEPDFENFTAWLSWLVDVVEAGVDWYDLSFDYPHFSPQGI